MHTSVRYTLAATLLALSVPLLAFASPVVRTGETIEVGAEQIVDGDFYAAGGAVLVHGIVHGDLYALAGTVSVSGEVEDDLVVVGGTVHIDGTIGEDVRIIGGEVAIGGTVEGDVLVAGGLVRILPTARVEGDVLFAVGEGDFRGNIRGALSGHGETILISGPVAGDVAVESARPLVLGDQASVEGNVSYRSAHEAVRAPGSVIEGDVEREARSVVSGGSLNLLTVLALFFTTFLYLFFFRERIEVLVRRALLTTGRHAALGLGVFVLVPLVATLLMITGIGLPIGAALVATYALVLVLAWSLAGILAGALLSRLVEGTPSFSYTWAGIGTAVVALATALPYIGPLVILLLMFVLMGTIGTALYAYLRR